MRITQFEKEWIDFCVNRHDVDCNQKYDNIHPYSFHLRNVAREADAFGHLLNDNKERKETYLAAWGHDLIEDARLTYNDVMHYVSSTFDGHESVTYENGNKQSVFIDGPVVVDIIYMLTDEKGKTRDERMGSKRIQELLNNPLATYVKMCDVISNVKYSLLTNSSMLKTYQKEYSKYYQLFHAPYKDMFDYYDKLIKI